MAFLNVLQLTHEQTSTVRQKRQKCTFSIFSPVVNLDTFVVIPDFKIL